MKRVFALLTLCAIALTGCRAITSPTPSPTVKPTTTPVPTMTVEPTIVPTMTVEPTEEITLEPTDVPETDVPTNTP